MGIKVAKFGGTSLADASQIRKVQAIVQADPERRFVVPSAPGKRTGSDQKITDLLYLCHEHARQKLPFDEVFKLIADRYLEIARGLGLTLDLKPHLDRVKHQIAVEACAGGAGTADYAASRGEYLNGLIVAELLGYEFIDAADVIFFDKRGLFDAELSGAIVARAANADVYENWTDVTGMLMADPRVVPSPKPIEVITYRELRELAYMGATVLHDEAIFPVRQAGIPVNIRNTNQPEHPGTLIVRDVPAEDEKKRTGQITGIAGRKDFTVITVEKALMNQELGFGRRLLTVLEANGISFEHMPSGIDTMSVVISDKNLAGKTDKVCEEINTECKPDTLECEGGMALVATVGRGMAYHPGIAAKLFDALARAGVNVRMIDQGSSEINIIVGVSTADFEKAMRAIYGAFVA
jgi:aspartate kinase